MQSTIQGLTRAHLREGIISRKNRKKVLTRYHIEWLTDIPAENPHIVGSMETNLQKSMKISLVRIRDSHDNHHKYHCMRNQSIITDFYSITSRGRFSSSIGANPVGVRTPQKFVCGGLIWLGCPWQFHWNKFNTSKIDTRSGFVSL